MNAHGTAHELPAGRLASFEDDDTADFASILGAKPRSAAPAEPQPDAEAPKKAPKKAPPATKKPAARKKATGTEAKQETARTPAYNDRANAIKSSSVHIPTPLLEQLVAYRDQHKMSNGQVVIAAIEHAHPKLKDLIHPATAGGGLFAQRATKGTRLNEGPLTPLNVRLFEADYEVIDNLVSEFGAFSRGHLITVSLREFFSGN